MFNFIRTLCEIKFTDQKLEKCLWLSPELIAAWTVCIVTSRNRDYKHVVHSSVCVTFACVSVTIPQHVRIPTRILQSLRSFQPLSDGSVWWVIIDGPWAVVDLCIVVSDSSAAGGGHTALHYTEAEGVTPSREPVDSHCSLVWIYFSRCLAECPNNQTKDNQ